MFKNFSQSNIVNRDRYSPYKWKLFGAHDFYECKRKQKCLRIAVTEDFQNYVEESFVFHSQAVSVTEEFWAGKCKIKVRLSGRLIRQFVGSQIRGAGLYEDKTIRKLWEGGTRWDKQAKG